MLRMSCISSILRKILSNINLTKRTYTILVQFFLELPSKFRLLNTPFQFSKTPNSIKIFYSQQNTILHKLQRKCQKN